MMETQHTQKNASGYLGSFGIYNLPEIVKRIDDIEAQLKRINVEFEKIAVAISFSSGKMPHKCPICEGKGKFRIEPKYSISSDGMQVSDQRERVFSPVEYNCKSCEGKGIVWG